MLTAATPVAVAETDEPAPAHVTPLRRRFVQVIPDALTDVARAAGLDLTERAALLELVLAADWRTGTLPRTTGRDLGHLWGVSPNTAIRLRRRLVAAGLIACHFERGREDGSVEVLCYGQVVASWPPPPPPVDNAESGPVARAKSARAVAQEPRERPAGSSPSIRREHSLPPPPPPVGPVDELLAEAGGRLPDPTPRQRRRLAELLAKLHRLGWHPAAVRANALARELDTADSPVAALIARLDRLGPPPPRPAIYVAPPGQRREFDPLEPEVRSTGRAESRRLRRRLAERPPA